MVIILRIANDRVTEFEAMFATEEIPIWDDFIARGFLRSAALRASPEAVRRRRESRITCSTSSRPRKATTRTITMLGSSHSWSEPRSCSRWSGSAIPSSNAELDLTGLQRNARPPLI
jgi:hypothetical protein